MQLSHIRTLTGNCNCSELAERDLDESGGYGGSGESGDAGDSG